MLFRGSLVVAERPPHGSRNTTAAHRSSLLCLWILLQRCPGRSAGVNPLRNHCFGMGSIYLGSKLKGEKMGKVNMIGGIGLQNGIV